MFSTKKENNELPDLPPLKPSMKISLPKFDEDEDEEKHELPSFPDSPTEKGFSQTAIKEAVKEEPINHEMEEWKPSEEHKISEPPAHRMPLASQIRPLSQAPPTLQPKTGPKSVNIFVQISKFHTAKKSIESAKEKLEEIDSLLVKLRETKMREEQELSSWEREVATVRAKVKDVTENIFEKMDVCQKA